MRQRQYTLPPLNQLEAFEAAARHLSFTRAADELALTQSAVSRQIAALEGYFGVPLFHRLHRALLLSDEGRSLQQAVVQALQQLHRVSTTLRGQPRVKTVVVSTTPGFAGLWLIPRLAGFTAGRPDVDVRISANNALVQLERDGVDVAIRYHTAEGVGADAQHLFGEVMLPVCSPALLRDAARPLKQPADLRHHCLLHMDYERGMQPLEWPPWLRSMKLQDLKPASVLHFSMYDQMIHAAIDGQGVALGRLPLLNNLLRQRKLVTPFKASVVSPRSYYVLQSEQAGEKPEVREFLAWLRDEAAQPAPTTPAPGSAGPAGRARP